MPQNGVGRMECVRVQLPLILREILIRSSFDDYIRSQLGKICEFYAFPDGNFCEFHLDLGEG